MSVTTVTEWTCDRCGEQWRADDTTRQPPGWAMARVTLPPWAEVDGHETRAVLLCDFCAVKLTTWLDTHVASATTKASVST